MRGKRTSRCVSTSDTVAPDGTSKRNSREPTISFNVAKNRSRTCILLDVNTDAKLGLLMKHALHLLLAVCLAFSACAPGRLTHDEVRRRMAEIGRSNLVPDAIEIRRIVSQSATSAIAEATVTLAFQFRRPNQNSEWHIEAVRLGDRDWISLDELVAALNEGRRRTTSASMQLLAEAIE